MISVRRLKLFKGWRMTKSEKGRPLLFSVHIQLWRLRRGGNTQNEPPISLQKLTRFWGRVKTNSVHNYHVWKTVSRPFTKISILGVKGPMILGQNLKFILTFECPRYFVSGVHYVERLTSILRLCNGVFTSRSIFRQGFPANCFRKGNHWLLRHQW